MSKLSWLSEQGQWHFILKLVETFLISLAALWAQVVWLIVEAAIVCPVAPSRSRKPTPEFSGGDYKI